MALSNDKSTFAVANMQDGVDIYDFSDELSFRHRSRSPIDPSRNCLLEVSFAESDSRVVSGTHFGEIFVWDANNGDKIQILTHGESLVNARTS